LPKFNTPCRKDGEKSFSEGENKRDSLTGQIGGEVWPTPTNQDAKNSTLPRSQGDRDTIVGAMLREGEMGALNPDWVEWLMGFPIGWSRREGANLRDAEALPLGTEPDIPRVTTTEPVSERRARLRCLGNAVVGLAAETVARAMIRL
jgi:hypothetical protein